MHKSAWRLANLRRPSGAEFHLERALHAAIDRYTGHSFKRGTCSIVVSPGITKMCLGVDQSRSERDSSS